MFKTAATMIAHNSTIPALAGSQPLQDLITAEKAVLTALQRISVDFTKASEALRAWGLSEGDDLGDILGSSAAILNHFSAALTQYATHGNGLREQLKAIRTREEDLDEMKRRRRAVFRKADDANKKLSKMNSEHKNLPMQTGLLNRLRDEVRSLDTDIIVEEAALSDFKRTAAKQFMGLKFGGLLECCQKGTIAANFGNMVISEISEEQTKPGLHRAFYQGHPKTEKFVAECQQGVTDVILSTVPTHGFRDRRDYYHDRDPPFVLETPEDKPVPAVPMDIRVAPHFPQPNEVPPSPQRQIWSETQDAGPAAFHLVQGRSSVDDFGMNLPRSNMGPMNNNDGPSVRFATFPVQQRQAAAPYPPAYTLDSRHDLGPSFASSIADALEHNDRPDPFADSATGHNAPSRSLPHPSTITPSLSTNPWAGPTEGTQIRENNLSGSDDALLAYLAAEEEEDRYSAAQHHLQMSEMNRLQAQHAREERRGSPSPELKLDKRTSVEDNMSRSSSLAKVMLEREGVATNSETVLSHLSSEEKEKALNAAVAREITVELEAFNADRSPVGRGRSRAGTGPSHASHGSSENAGRDSPPLDPPSAPFTRRSISATHPYPEVNIHSHGPPHGLGGPVPISVPFNQPQENQYSRSQGVPINQAYHSRPQHGNSPLSGSLKERPSISMNNPFSIGVGPGARTISAAAFKKPRRMSMDSLQGSSKGLPVAPNPPLGVGAGPRVFSASGIPPSSASHMPPSERSDKRSSHVEPYRQPLSPFKPEFGDTYVPRADVGYKTGNFTTDLEQSSLRKR